MLGRESWWRFVEQYLRMIPSSLTEALGRLDMKRRIAAGLSILAVVATVGWKLARQPESSVGLQEVSLKQHSEHSHPGPNNALAGIRIRLMPYDFSYAIKPADNKVPQIAVATE
jgi:hypothetical protein